MGLLKRWNEYARQYGRAGLFRHIAARLVRPLWEASSAELLVVEPPVQLLSAKVPIQVSRLEPAAAEGAHSDWADRWQKGDVCYGAWLNGELIHHSWVSTRKVYIGEVHGWLQIQGGEAYIYDCFTAASCRGLGIFPAVLTLIGEDLFRSSIERIWIAVEEENQASRKAIVRAGFREAGSVRFRRAGPWVNRVVHQKPSTPPIRIG